MKKVRFKAEIYTKGDQTLVDVFEYQTKDTTTLTFQEFSKKRKWYSFNGGIMIEHRK